TNRSMSIDRDVFWRSIASRSASSMITNWPFATSQPRTISSFSTIRSWNGHHFRFWIGVWHSSWSCRKEMSDARADGFVAGASPTGIVTRLKLIDPFQVVRIGAVGILSTRRRSFLRARRGPAVGLTRGRDEDDRRALAARGGTRRRRAGLP